MFFDRPDRDLASAKPGSFALMPAAGMLDSLRQDFRKLAAMILGTVPEFNDVMRSVEELDRKIDQPKEVDF